MTTQHPEAGMSKSGVLALMKSVMVPTRSHVSRYKVHACLSRLRGKGLQTWPQINYMVVHLVNKFG